MELQAAHQIIALAQGVHPITVEAMPEDSPYNAPPVIRALFAEVDAGQASPRAAGIAAQCRALGGGRRREARDGIRRWGGVAPTRPGPGSHAFCG